MTNRVKELRKANGLTQKELADLAGTTVQQISYVENGKRPLSYNMAWKLGKVFNESPGLLMGEDETELTVLERRLQHLLKSEFIRSFDQVDPRTHEYARNIAEADIIAAFGKQLLDELEKRWDMQFKVSKQ